MPNPDRQSKPVIHRSEQNVQNSSFDETYQVTATEMLVENSAQTALVRLSENMLGGVTNAQLRATPVPVKDEPSDVDEATLQNAFSATGNGSSTNCDGYDAVLFVVSGTFIATVNFEASIDDSTWVPILTSEVGNSHLITSTFRTGLFRASISGIKFVRARISSYVSGSITVVARKTAVEAQNNAINAMPFDGQNNRSAGVTLLQDLTVGAKGILISDTFTAGVDANKWTTTASGTGAVAATSGVARFTTGATANSSIAIQLTQTKVFYPGTVTVFASGVKMGDTGTANNRRRWGMFTATDGYFFELNGTTLSAVVRKAGADTLTSIANFVMDTNLHTYEMEYQGDACQFKVDRTVYASLGGVVSTVRTDTLDLPIRYENTNINGSTTNVTMDVRSTSHATRGEVDPESGHPFIYAGSSGTVVLGANDRVVSITVMSESNSGTVRIDLGGITGSTIPVRNNWGFNFDPHGQIIGATLIFTSTVSYMVAVVK